MTTAWACHRLLFSHMYEDYRVEEAALEDCQRILAIASAGDTALVLAAGGASVTAIDINPAQIAFLERRLSSLGSGGTGRGDHILGTGQGDHILGTGQGDRNVGTGQGDRNVGTGQGDRNVGTGQGDRNVGTRQGDHNVGTGQGDRNVGTGQMDRILGAGRSVLRVAGWRRDRLERFCQMADPEQQVAEWRRLTAGLPGRTLRVLLAPAALRVAYRRDFVRWAGHLGRQLPDRIEQGLARHPNRDNPWVRLLFLGTAIGVPPGPPARVATVVGDVAAHLEHVEPGRYDGFALSNVLDGAPPDYTDRLRAALRRAGTPDAPVVLRTLGAASSPGTALAAAGDRALIWGGITVTEAGALR